MSSINSFFFLSYQSFFGTAFLLSLQAYCTVLGGHLLKITSQTSQNAAAGVMKTSESKNKMTVSTFLLLFLQQ